MKRILIIALIISSCLFAVSTSNILLKRDMYKTKATVTSVLLPDGIVTGNFRDSDGTDHIDEYLFSSFQFQELRAVKTVDSNKIKKYKGTEVTILYDKDKNKVINYDRLRNNTMVSGVIVLLTSLSLFAGRKRYKN